MMIFMVVSWVFKLFVLLGMFKNNFSGNRHDVPHKLKKKSVSAPDNSYFTKEHQKLYS